MHRRAITALARIIARGEKPQHFRKELFDSERKLFDQLEKFNLAMSSIDLERQQKARAASLSPRQRYKTRANISFKRAAELSGFAPRTLQNLEKDPKNSGYPGRNVPEHAFLAWALGYQSEKVKKHWANMMNHPIPVSELPPFLREKLAL